MKTEPPGRSSPRPETERKPREERWPEIIDVASQIFYEKGYKGSSLQEIADRLGIRKSSLYYYFATKDDLLYEVIRHVHRVGLDNSTALASGPGDALARLERVIIGHAEHTCKYQVKTAVFFDNIAQLSEERRKAALGDDQRYRSLVVDLITEAQRDGFVRPDVEPSLAALTVLGSLNWVHRWYVPDGRFSPNEIGRAIAAQAIRGLVDGTPGGEPADVRATHRPRQTEASSSGR